MRENLLRPGPSGAFEGEIAAQPHAGRQAVRGEPEQGPLLGNRDAPAVERVGEIERLLGRVKPREQLDKLAMVDCQSSLEIARVLRRSKAFEVRATCRPRPGPRGRPVWAGCCSVARP